MTNPLDSFPDTKLTRDQEEALAKKLPQPAALNKLVLHCMREAVTYAGYCTKGMIPQGELISICYAAMMRNGKNFKPGYARFFAYCKPAIRGDLKRSWETSNVVKHRKTISWDILESEAAQETYRRDPQARLEDTVPDLINQGEHVVVSSESMTGMIAEPEFGLLRTKERWEYIKGIIDNVCNEREKSVLELNYQGGFNCEEIARMLHVTRSAIQATRAGALRKVRCALLEKGRLFND